MEQYAGIDVSLDSASVCIVDAQGKIVKEAKVASEPGHREAALCARPYPCPHAPVDDDPWRGRDRSADLCRSH